MFGDKTEVVGAVVFAVVLVAVFLLAFQRIYLMNNPKRFLTSLYSPLIVSNSLLDSLIRVSIVFLLGVSIVFLLGGCASNTPDWVPGSPSKNCRQIGCGQGLVFYPNERFGAVNQAKRWYGFEWGETSSAYPKSDPRHWELLQKEKLNNQ